MPHIIRLRGPWEYEPLLRLVPQTGGQLLQTKENLPAGGSIQLPADWDGALGPDYQGTVRFTRRFHRPTGLDAASRVWLVIDDVDWEAGVAIHNRFLGDIVCSQSVETPDSHRCPARFDITADLQPQNLLSITVTSPCPGDDSLPSPRRGREGQAGGLIGLVWLEIE